MSRTTLYILLFIVLLLLLSIIEPSVKAAVFFAFMLTLFNYMDTFIHELGHYLAGKLAGFELKQVIIGDRQQFASIKVFGTSFVFRYGFGGLTVLGSSVKFSRLRYSIFALGGVMLQLVVIGIIYASLGIGNEENYFLPLIFMALNLRTILVNLYPRMFTLYGEQHASDGLLLKKLIQMKKVQ